MCTVSINIDEAVIRDLRPELNTTAAIRSWVQELIDSRLQQIREECASDRAKRRGQALKRDMSPEQLYSLISEEIDEIYANN